MPSTLPLGKVSPTTSAGNPYILAPGGLNGPTIRGQVDCLESRGKRGSSPTTSIAPHPATRLHAISRG